MKELTVKQYAQIVGYSIRNVYRMIKVAEVNKSKFDALVKYYFEYQDNHSLKQKLIIQGKILKLQNKLEKGIIHKKLDNTYIVYLK